MDDLMVHLCHRHPERSWLTLGGHVLICNRCLGLYLGFALGVGLVRSRRLWLGALLAVSTVLEWGTEILGFWDGSNAWRLATALLSGFGLAWLCGGRTRVGPVEWVVLASLGLLFAVAGMWVPGAFSLILMMICLWHVIVMFYQYPQADPRLQGN